MSEQCLILPDNTVIEFSTADHELGARATLVDSKFIYQGIGDKFSQHEDSAFNLDWFGQGVRCKFIRHMNSSKGRIDGRLRLRLAFFPSRHILGGSHLEDRCSSEWMEACNEDVIMLPHELLDLPSGHVFHLRKPIFSKQDLTKNLRQYLSLSDINWYRYAWLDYGVPCKILLSEMGVDGWINGRIWLKVELRADLEGNQAESESSLDEIRNLVDVK
jgi:KGK domain